MLGDLPGILNRLFALPLTENPLNIRCAISNLVADLDGLQIPFPIPMPERCIAYAAQLLDLLLGQEAYLACLGDLGGQLLFGAIDQMAEKASRSSPLTSIRMLPGASRRMDNKSFISCCFRTGGTALSGGTKSDAVTRISE